MLENSLVRGAQAHWDRLHDEADSDARAKELAFETLKQRATELMTGKALAIEVPGFRNSWTLADFLSEEIGGKDGEAVLVLLAMLFLGFTSTRDQFIAERARKFADFYASDLVDEWKGEEL